MQMLHHFLHRIVIVLVIIEEVILKEEIVKLIEEGEAEVEHLIDGYIVNFVGTQGIL